MNREQKAAVIDEVASQIEGSEAIFAVDYRGMSVPQAAELRQRLVDAGASFRVVKNTLTIRAADRAGADDLKGFLEGPTAFTFVSGGGDVALAAKAIATFRREHDVPAFKGGRLDGAPLTIEEVQALATLPAREVLHGQLVGTLASPVTGLVRGLHQLIQGLASQLGQIADQGLVSGSAPEPEPAPETPVETEDVSEETAGEPETGDDGNNTTAQPAEPAAESEESEAPSEGTEEG